MASNKALKQENLQLAVFTAFNILANYKFPLNEALAGTTRSTFKSAWLILFLTSKDWCFSLFLPFLWQRLVFKLIG